MSVAISVDRISKRYVLNQPGSGRTLFSEAVVQGIRNLPLRLRRGGGAEKPSPEFWALKEISFSVEEGDRLAVIGRNGAGKSTLLKLLSRITEPTEGSIRIRGRVASLLEVGTGFHPELTGRENIFLNGIILGMTKREVEKSFDQIVQFAEIEQFLDTPVKRYSSGMYVRLAFSVAAHMETDILMVDEVLAVGDLRFQEKCLSRMHDATSQGRTIVFVSHNMAAVARLCNKAIVIDSGRLQFEGGVGPAIETYIADSKAGGSSLQWFRPSDASEAPLELLSVHITLENDSKQSRMRLDLEYRSRSPHPDCYITLDFVEAAGTTVMQAMPTIRPFLEYRGTGNLQSVQMEVDLPGLVPGIYDVSVWHGSHNSDTVEWWKRILRFTILESPVDGRTYPHPREHGFIVAASRLLISPK